MSKCNRVIVTVDSPVSFLISYNNIIEVNGTKLSLVTAPY